MGAKAGSGVFPLQSGMSRVLGPTGAWAAAELTPAHGTSRGKGSLSWDRSFPGRGMNLFHSLRSPTLIAQCTLAQEVHEGWAQRAKPESAALRGSCHPQVICSVSNYLNIFTGEEGNEGARKRGMGGKSSFSNCKEVIKKIQETGTLLCTVSLPLAPTQVSLVFTKEHWGDYLSLIIPGSICKCTSSLQTCVCQLLSSTLHPGF